MKNMPERLVSRRHQERGSALLLVLVFAAVIAIMLYRELPIAAFEAQRQKEELLVARGNEYKRGVKLFVRKVGRFPSSINELENTNRMRFLRHRFVDPLTGKDDWRLIHAGPGGIIIDSKVPGTNSNGTQQASTLGQGATFAGFNNSFTGDATAAAAAAADNAPSAGMRQRPPPTKNAASAAVDPMGNIPGVSDAPDPGGNPNAALAPAVDPATGQTLQPNPPNGNGITTLAEQLNNINPPTPQTAPTAAGQPQPPAGGLGNTSSFGGANNTLGNPQNLVGNQGPNQMTAGGGIAGVASKAEGKGIMRVNEQKKYNLWEFYYDMRKEQAAGAAGALGQNQGNANGLSGSGTNSNGTNSGINSGFGSTQPSQGIGGPSSFGIGNTPPQTPQQPTPPQPQ